MKKRKPSKNIPNDLREKCNRITEILRPNKPGKENWEWCIPKSTAQFSITEETSEEEIFNQLDKMLSEMKEAEDKIKENLD